MGQEYWRTNMQFFKRGREILLEEYRLKYGDSFPLTNKIDEVLDDAESTERMVNQILCRTFTCQKGHDKALLPTGSEAWQAHKSLLVEDYLITCLQNDRDDAIGARYKVAFSRRFPHFEVMILESAESKCIALGVVFEDVGTQLSLGNEGTVGYYTKGARIHDSSSESGSRVALRGNVIRCTVVFEKEQEVDGKIQVPVVFSVNGSRIDPMDKYQSFIEYSEDRPLFPYVAFYKENRVLAKMCAREDVDYQGQEINSRLDKIEAKLGGQEIKSRLDEIEAKFGQEMKSRLAEVESKLECFDKKINGVRECCEKNLSMMETLLKK